MLNISSIKELLHKPSEIQWNMTETLLGKVKRKISCALSYKMLPPEITKTCEIAILGDNLGNWEPMWNSMFFYDFVNFWKFQSLNWFNFKLGFFTYFEYILGGIIRQNILHSDYHSARWYWCKKTRKTFHKLDINVFLFVAEFLKLWSLHCYEHLWFKNPPELQVLKLQKIPMMIKLFEVEEQISIGKCIKLCFHVQRFSVNCFCVSFNSLFENV